MKKLWKIIILSVLILALIAVSYFLYNKWQESKMGLVSFEKATEQKIDGKTYIENKDVGLKFVVPDGWELGKYSEGVSMHSSDFVPFTEDSFFIPKSGCWIELYSKVEKEGSDYDLDYSYLKNEIVSNYCSRYQNNGQKACEDVKISGLNGIRENNFNDEQKNPGFFTSLRVPYNNIVYAFSSYFFGKDKEACIQEFNNFLTTVTIKK
jgi:hypothetical protein